MDAYELVADTSWEGIHVDLHKIDSGARLAASLLDAFDAEQLYRRTGMVMDAKGGIAQPACPIFISLAPGKRGAHLARLARSLHGIELRLPRAWVGESFDDERLGVVTAVLHWPDAFDRAAPNPRGRAFREALAQVAASPAVTRVSLPRPLQPCLAGSLRDIDLPADRIVQGRELDGNGIVIGIIDDGCAFAHRHFLVKDKSESRILALWDQARTIGSADWTDPLPTAAGPSFGGKELTKKAIDAVLLKHANHGRIDEDAVYAELGYDLDLTTHGTHVMDIAAGNGDTPMGTEGVAPKADIVFVQLPRDQVATGGPPLEQSIFEGVAYVLLQAKRLGKPAVVNISYGAYSGPHDGSSPLPQGIDNLLANARDQAVVVSAGNGFEADCHATWRADPGKPKPLTWILAPEDPTANEVELWSEGAAALTLQLTAPGGHVFTAAPGKDYLLTRTSDGHVIGWVRNGTVTPDSIQVHLNATLGAGGAQATMQMAQGGILPPPLTAPAPAGGWRLQLRGAKGAKGHAWIGRDDLKRGGRRQQQSRFAEQDADPTYTLADLATGKLSIAVGAHNAATGETCRYSACGPTRDARHKPEVTAPAEETALGGGIRCASARSARPTAFNGTSASAPHVAGVVALLLQYRRDQGAASLSPQEIAAALRKGAIAAQALPLPPWRVVPANLHQQVDPHRPPGKRHGDHLGDVIGDGKVNVPQSVIALP